MTEAGTCRFCDGPLAATLVDLGVQPPANHCIDPDRAAGIEPFHPLRAAVCGRCFLVQIEEVVPPGDIFNDDYPYHSSFSDSWLAHCEAYAGEVVRRFGLGRDSLVVELGSNDGSLLACFRRLGVPVLGVEPAGSCARRAVAAGVPTRIAFFGRQAAESMAAESLCADLVVGNNVLAHAPDINDFAAGIAVLLKPGGSATLEFPDLLAMLRGRQFDTIYHEHYWYLSLTTACRIFEAHGLSIYDAERLPTHGGSIRVYGAHGGGALERTERCERLLREEAGLNRLETYREFGAAASEARNALLAFLHEARRVGKSVAGYGAPAKGNTLLNYCGIGPDLLPYTVDRNPRKQNTLLPGSRIPVFAPERIDVDKPDYLLVLPWNLRDEIAAQMAHIDAWGGRFVTAIPTTRVFGASG